MGQDNETEHETEHETDSKGDDARARQAFVARDRAMQEARQLRQRLTEYETTERKQAEERERAAGDFAALEKRYQAQLAELEQQVATVAGERDGLVRQQRQGQIVERLATEAGISNRRLLERLLPDIGLADVDPSTVTRTEINTGIKRLRDVAPELFGAASTKKPPVDGGEQLDKSDPAYWRRVGERFTTGTSASAQYAKATGRT